ncbi:MAG TPA: DUF1801 domain-containing protein [Thermoanaerobaculia bacterium]
MQPVTTPKDIDAYIAGYPETVQTAMQQLRKTIHKAAPGIEEAIKYNMPTFVLNGINLVHFAAYKHHIGFYPAPREADEFKDELAGYDGAKSSVSFSLEAPMPLDLVTRIVKHRIAETGPR